MVIYYCDGSRRKTRLGVGIVRIEKEKAEYFSYYRDDLPMDYNHEIYAFEKVLELAEKKGDSSIHIQNDERQLVKLLKRYKEKRGQRTTLERNSQEIQKRIGEMKEKGISIKVSYIKKEKGKGFHHQSHLLSRSDWTCDHS